MCGIAKPTNAIGPAIATAEPQRRMMTIPAAIRIVVIRCPNDIAISSPRLRMFICLPKEMPRNNAMTMTGNRTAISSVPLLAMEPASQNLA